jgi:hypothetical protein
MFLSMVDDPERCPYFQGRPMTSVSTASRAHAIGVNSIRKAVFHQAARCTSDDKGASDFQNSKSQCVAYPSRKPGWSGGDQSLPPRIGSVGKIWYNSRIESAEQAIGGWLA